jgi:hypothetical protein
MKGRLIILIACVLTISGGAQAHSKHSQTTKYPSYDGLVMAGYQGWFRVGRDGQMYPSDAQIRIDLWPDVSEYEKTYPTGLKLADGSTARFFNSADKSTVDLHFKWMKDCSARRCRNGNNNHFMRCRLC